MVKISIKNVIKVFGKGDRTFEAIKNVSFEIRSSSFFGILGASGAGKTTMMRLIAGLETPTKGAILFDDKVVSQDGKEIVPVEERNVGLVFQNWALYPHLSNYENIAFPLKVMRWRSEDIKARVFSLAETLGISEVVYKRPGQVSGGQQQRVALARALSKNPSLLLLDEPFSNLDANTKDDARSLVRSLQQKFGVTAIIVSHDPSDIFSLAEEVAVISKGELIQVATPKELYDRPKNMKVARSLGEMNLIEGSFTKSKSGTSLVIKGLATIDNFLANDVEVPDNIMVGIRPEDLILLRSEISNESVKNIDYAPGEELVKLGELKSDAANYSEGSFIISMPFNNGKSRINGINREAFFPGDEVTLYVKKSKIKIFDSSSGDLISITQLISN